MDLERDPEGNLWFRSISPLHADTLLRMEEWIESDDARVRDRLMPRVYEDADAEEQWQRYGTPELEHLFADRLALVSRDLETLARDGDLTFSFCIRAGHETAWLSSLNAARLALFELSDLDAEDMERDPVDIDDPDKELALIRIHVMAYMQEMMIDA